MEKVSAISTFLRKSISSRTKHLLLLVLVAIVSLVIYIKGKEFVSIAHPDSSIEVDSGYLSVATDSMRPSEQHYGVTISLDNFVYWPSIKPYEKPSSEFVWITSLIELETPADRIWSIYVPHTNYQFKFFVNGLELADIDSAISNNDGGSYSSLVSVPNGVLRSGPNEIQLRIARADHSEFVLVPPFLMGPLSEIAPYYMSQTLFSESFPKTIIVLLTILGVALLLVWMTCKAERVYLALCACSFVWAGYLVARLPNANQVLEYEQLSTLSSLMLFIFAISLFYLCLSYSSSKIGNTKVLAISLGCVVLLNVVLSIDSKAHILSPLLVCSMLCLIFIGITVLVVQKVRLPSSAYVVLSILLLLSFQIIDQTAFQNLAVYSAYSPLQFIAPVFILVVVTKMLRDFIQSRRNLEMINKNLEKIIEQRTSKIESEMLERKKIEQEKLLADERNRLMMEMHDGLGARLVGAISQMDSSHAYRNTENVRLELREALNELRLVVDSMNPIEGDLVAVLGMFRQRLQKTLQGTPKKLIWQVADLPAIEDLSPEKTLNILRILQEATTNAIKYSAGTTISVTASATLHGEIAIGIVDDGVGFAEDGCCEGQGFGNMRKRAQKIGASLDIQTTSSGLSVILRFDAGSPIELAENFADRANPYPRLSITTKKWPEQQRNDVHGILSERLPAMSPQKQAEQQGSRYDFARRLVCKMAGDFPTAFNSASFP